METVGIILAVSGAVSFITAGIAFYAGHRAGYLDAYRSAYRETYERAYVDGYTDGRNDSKGLHIDADTSTLDDM